MLRRNQVVLYTLLLCDLITVLTWTPFVLRDTSCASVQDAWIIVLCLAIAGTLSRIILVTRHCFVARNVGCAKLCLAAPTIMIFNIIYRVPHQNARNICKVPFYVALIMQFVEVMVLSCCLSTNDTRAVPTPETDNIALDNLPASTKPFTCTICLQEDVPVGANSIILPCLHVFHRECFLAWARHHLTCPICRASAEPNQTDTTALSHISTQSEIPEHS